ncbi:helix-turn-helix domain-containing protein [Planctobacterium marinum]|uniref:HTH cro/C1-type domain-containing protein n=1 Tax=Planctobacterium marinum TaxID=1631968 RepID=A0AA48HM86_9ALTE|nr:hypothetical protein MACH26_33450 [Planctobacterium marinum]
MANKSTDILHVERSDILRSLRLQSSFTQKQIADKLGISREKVVAVENCHLKSMLALELDTIKNWWNLCRSRADMETQKQFAKLMRKELSI